MAIATRDGRPIGAGAEQYDRPRAPEARQGALGDDEGDIEPDDLPFAYDNKFAGYGESMERRS